MSKKIAYIGEFKFPKGDAASVRVLGVGQILAECGFEVTFHGTTMEKDKYSVEPEGTYKGFKYSNLFLKNGNILKRISNRFFAGYRLTKIMDTDKPDYIIVAGGYSRYLVPVLIYARKNNIKVIVDVVEWFDYSHLPGGKYGLFALDVHLALTKFMKKSDGIIAISSFLESYYKKSNLPAIRVPIVIDSSDSKWYIKGESFDPESLNLVYAGVPGKKDWIAIAIYGINELIKEGHCNIKLHLIGPTENDIKALLDENVISLEALRQNILFYGRTDQEKVPALLSKADFSVLIRPNERYANAGFPTKFVESLAIGLPVIANLTSDLEMYLKDGENGFIISDNSIEAFKNSLRKALLLTDSEKIEMKKNAKLTAREFFEYQSYIGDMNTFVQKI